LPAKLCNSTLWPRRRHALLPMAECGHRQRPALHQSHRWRVNFRLQHRHTDHHEHSARQCLDYVVVVSNNYGQPTVTTVRPRWSLSYRPAGGHHASSQEPFGDDWNTSGYWSDGILPPHPPRNIPAALMKSWRARSCARLMAPSAPVSRETLCKLTAMVPIMSPHSVFDPGRGASQGGRTLFNVFSAADLEWRRIVPELRR